MVSLLVRVYRVRDKYVSKSWRGGEGRDEGVGAVEGGCRNH